ncbi:MAG: MurR/RpiR family transcriptional regulator [Lachnospiraceae bacterium]|nr:MurR/RpiR family transcriptional regulator [Lachnospiraceae bacterium]
MDKIDVIGVIDEFYPSMSKGHKAIANYIKEYYDTAVFMTAAKIGEEIGVSESTVVRFASSLGYDGFPDFQSCLASWVKNRMNNVQKIGAKYGNSSQSQIIDSVLKGDIERINDTLTELDPNAFEAAIDALLQAKKVYITGIRACAPLAEFLAFYLNMIRDDVICLTTTSVSETFEQMLRIDNNDAFVGISFPRYSMRTLKAMEFASDRNAKVVSITDSIHSPMCMYSSINLFSRSDMVSVVDSLVAPLSVINALVVAFCLKAPEEVKENLNKLEDAWANYQVYLNDEINFINDEPMVDYSLTKDKDNKQE